MSLSSLLPLSKTSPFLPKPTFIPIINSYINFSKAAMNSSSSKISAAEELQHVPGLSNHEMDQVAARTFHKYSSPLPKREGKGVAIVWFRNDLRIIDNEALFKAWISSQSLLPVYCVDPRLFSSTYYFGFPKTGVLRARFLMECLSDLKRNLKKRGLDLLIKEGKPENILPLLALECGAHTVYAQKETCSEEVNVEKLVKKNLQQMGHKLANEVTVKPYSTTTVKLELVWGASMYHIDDLPFDCKSLPDVYTQFRKAVESMSLIRGCLKIPLTLGPPPDNIDWGVVPDFTQLGFQQPKASRGMIFVGGETAAISRVHEYFWKKDLLRVYKDTRNGMLGPDYSTKFSPWFASGSLSPRFVCEEVKRYETERGSNNSTYWVLFELIWRDYFRFLSIKQGNSLFHPGGPRNINVHWRQDRNLFDTWRDGKTGYPLVDACMKELSTTGFMSNRGRQIVCSFLVRDMGIDWRMGAEWFETCLLDYDPCSNYGNWTYGAGLFLILEGVGNDPREDRYFSIPKQAQTYDPHGEFVSYWLPELRALPKESRHFPANSYIKPIVPLKYGRGGASSTKAVAFVSQRKIPDNKPKGRGGRRMQ